MILLSASFQPIRIKVRPHYADNIAHCTVTPNPPNDTLPFLAPS